MQKSQHYDELMSNPMDAKQHPDNLLPDPTNMFMDTPPAIKAGQFINAVPRIGKNNG